RDASRWRCQSFVLPQVSGSTARRRGSMARLTKNGTVRRVADWNQRSTIADAKSAGFDRKGRFTMRSDLIFGALTHVSNRYKLCQLASKATRKLHKPNTRVQDTTNDVMIRFRDTVPMAPADIESANAERRAA